MSEKRAPKRSSSAMGRLILVVLVFSLIGIILYRNYLSSSKGAYTNVPKELQVNYIPADFDIDIDEEQYLTVLTNPQNNRKAFNQMVYNLNIQILDHVAERMGLTVEQRSMVRGEYEKHHPYLRNLYFNDFMRLKDTTSLDIQTWYESESTNSTNFLREVASKYTCFLVNHVISSIIETDEEGKILGRGANVNTPCGIAMAEALTPMIKRLEDRAAVRDINLSRGLMQERVEKVLAQLITYEVQDKKAISKNLQTKIWGFTVSSTDIEISAISVIKVGFDLSKFFEVKADSRNKIVTITLPQPEILAQEAYPRFEKLDIGWLREVETIDLNQSIEALRAEFRRTALTPDVEVEAKKEAAVLMKTMFSPVVNALSNDYDLRVKFLNRPTNNMDDGFLNERPADS